MLIPKEYSKKDLIKEIEGVIDKLNELDEIMVTLFPKCEALVNEYAETTEVPEDKIDEELDNLNNACYHIEQAEFDECIEQLNKALWCLY